MRKKSAFIMQCDVSCSFLKNSLEKLDDFSHRVCNACCITENNLAIQHSVCVERYFRTISTS
jgi:hypothetical protein